MKILISEEQFIRLKEAELEEAVGVPDFIISTSSKIFDKMISKIKKEKIDIEELENETITLTGIFPIGDVVVRKIIIDFKILKLPKGSEREWMSATHHSVSKVLNTFVLKTANKKTEIKMGFSLAINEGDNINDFTNFLSNIKTSLVPTIAHELHHAYFEKKAKYEPLKKRAGYQALQGLRFPFIEPINKFFFNSYYIHAIENVVRPTELAAHMDVQGITRSKFLKFFNDSEIIQNLKDIRNFSYQNLRDELTTYTNIIKTFLEKLGVDTENMTEEQLVNEILRISVVNIINRKGETMKEILTTNPVEMFFGFSGDKDRFFRKYINFVSKFGDNYELFYKSEEKNMNRIADQVLKKLAKLYSIAKKDSE